MNKTFYKYFVFLDELNSTIKQNIVKIRNINVIIDISKPEENFKLFLNSIFFNHNSSHNSSHKTNN